MFGIGEGELLIIMAFAFMIFGPDKLPGMGRTIGRALRQFRQAQEGFTEVVQAEVMDPLQEAMGDPLDTGTRKSRRDAAEQRAAALAQDADRTDVPGAVPTRKETFAERKARLAAEREARQAASAAGGLADAGAQAPEDADAAEPTSVDAPSQVAQAPASAEPAAPDTSAAALYAMGGRSSFAAAKQQAAEEAAAKAAEEAAAADAPTEADATIDGKEERDA